MGTYLIIGSGGIGSEVGRLLVEKGNKVISLSRTHAQGHSNGIAYLQIGDLALEETPLPEISEALSGLVYCPGTINLKPFRGLKQTDFMNDLQVNYLGAVRCIQKYLGNLTQNPGSGIVLFSTVAVGKGMAFHASIAGAKGAVEGLTRSLAAELAPKVRVNAIAPSITQTPLADKLLNAEAKLSAAKERHPLKQVGQTHDIAQAVLFALNNAWLTGQVIAVDGGLSTLS